MFFFEQANSQRMQPNVGLSLQWIDRKWDVHGDVLIGSVIQNAQIIRVHRRTSYYNTKSKELED